MSAPAEDANRRLPLLAASLPPRQLKKIDISCKRWLTRFLLTLSSAAERHRITAESLSTPSASDTILPTAAAGAAAVSGTSAHGLPELIDRVCPSWPQASGFVALNGGILAGCSPYDVRGVLLEQELIFPHPAAAETVLQYSSTLPFVLCTRPMVVRSSAHADDVTPRLSALYVTAAELGRYAAGSLAAAECGGAANGEAMGAPLRCGAVGVALLQLPPSASLWKGGSSTASSANTGSGFLFLLPCDVAAVQALLADVFQKPVVGIERLLPRTVSRVCSAADEVVADPVAPRVCISKAVGSIPGLFLVDDFVTHAEEAAIWSELHDNRQQLQLEYLSRRRVAHFNRRFLYGKNEVTKEGVGVNARPTFYEWMRVRLQNRDPTGAVRIAGDFPRTAVDYECDQLTVNYYDYSAMGACGIATHVDAHKAFEDAILVVSLGSYTVMEYARWDTPAEVTAPRGVYLPPRSLAVMTGEARYGWTHCIAEKRTDTISELVPTLTRGDRLSLTWRRGRRTPHRKAECAFPALCDGE